MKPRTWPRALNTPERRAVATNVLLVVAVIGLGLASNRDVHHSPVWAVLPAIPLLWRRRYPVPVLGLVLAFVVVQASVRESSWSGLALFVALYTVAARRPPRTTAIAAAACEATAIAAVASYFGLSSATKWLAALIGLSGLVVAAVAVGMNVRSRRALVASLRERAVRLEIERDQEGRLAAADERARIASEMHDIVAHNLSVMVALADGASFAANDAPDRAEHAMTEVARTGRDALLEMRRLLGVLRDEADQGRAPQPGLAQLDDLVGQVRAAGLPVELRTEGAPPNDPSPGLQLALYRIVQESLTNALKHAGEHARATVDLRWSGDQLTIDVKNTGHVGAPPTAGGGLRGMRHRAETFGGRLETGPDPTGGWRVRARLSDVIDEGSPR